MKLEEIKKLLAEADPGPAPSLFQIIARLVAEVEAARERITSLRTCLASIETVGRVKGIGHCVQVAGLELTEDAAKALKAGFE